MQQKQYEQAIIRWRTREELLHFIQRPFSTTSGLNFTYILHEPLRFLEAVFFSHIYDAFIGALDMVYGIKVGHKLLLCSLVSRVEHNFFVETDRHLLFQTIFTGLVK